VEAPADLALRIGFLAAGALVLLGCPNPNTYTTPRTIGSGHFQGSAAVEGWGYIPTTSANYTPQERSGIYPAPPTFSLRLGLGNSWEIGARLGNLTSLGGDIKWNFLKSRKIDLAIDPAFQIYELSADDGSGKNQTFTYLHVPLLVGVNLSRTVSLVFTPGATWGFTSAGMIRFTDGPNQGTTTGAIARFGVGADFRIMPGFALHPELTLLRGLGGDERIIYIAGLGFNFGAMPNYDDVGADPPPPSDSQAPGVLYLGGANRE
jgi:hypothetical protein